VSRILGIAPLRSFVAVADCGGFQRAATALHLSQGAVSQHVRRLESALGRALVERDGRRSRFTADGEALLTKARRILAAHDETLRDFAGEPEQTPVIGSTEHAAARLLPELATCFPDHRVRFRIDRGAQLKAALVEGRIDVALLLGIADDADARTVGELELTWYSAPDWVPPPPGGPIPLVAFDAPCALRDRALETLAAHGVAAEVSCETAHLAGMQSAVRAGLGVGLMATLGEGLEGLVARPDLPDPPPVPLSARPRRGLRPEVIDTVAAAVLQRHRPHTKLSLPIGGHNN
jgi:DNA-binding transcriptional LysR family regulator